MYEQNCISFFKNRVLFSVRQPQKECLVFLQNHCEFSYTTTFGQLFELCWLQKESLCHVAHFSVFSVD